MAMDAKLLHAAKDAKIIDADNEDLSLCWVHMWEGMFLVLHFILYISQCMTKPTKWQARSAKTQINLGICPSWSVFVCMQKAWILSYPLAAQQRLIRLGRCLGWPESLLGAHPFCRFCHALAHMVLSFQSSNLTNYDRPWCQFWRSCTDRIPSLFHSDNLLIRWRCRYR